MGPGPRLLRRWRIAHRVTLSEIAERLGHDGESGRQNVGAYERGKRQIPILQLSVLSAVTGIPVRKLATLKQLAKLDRLESLRRKKGDHG